MSVSTSAPEPNPLIPFPLKEGGTENIFSCSLATERMLVSCGREAWIGRCAKFAQTSGHLAQIVASFIDRQEDTMKSTISYLYSPVSPTKKHPFPVSAPGIFLAILRFWREQCSTEPPEGMYRKK